MKNFLGVALLGLAITIAPSPSDHCRAEDPSATKMPKDRSELFKLMIQMLGNPDIAVSERHAVENILAGVQDPALIPTLIQALDDERTFDPEMEVPSGNGEKSKYTVGDICMSLLKEMVGMSPRGCYHVKDWRAWWVDHQSKSMKEIREEIRAVEAKGEKK